MRKMTTAAALLLALGTAPLASASTAVSAASQLRTALKREISLKSVGGSGSSAANELQNLLSQLSEAVMQGRQGNLSYLESTLDRITTSSTDPAVKTAADATLAEATAQMKERDAAFIKASDATAARLATAALDAKSTADLDPLLREAGALRTSYSGNASEEVQRVLQQTNSLRRFIQYVQDYRYAAESGDVEKTREAAQRLQGDSDYQGFAPRSRLLAMMNPLAPAAHPAQARLPDEKGAQLLKRIKTFDDIEPAVQAWSAKYTANDYTSRLLTKLTKWNGQYRNLLKGAAASINNYDVEDGAEPTLVTLRNQLIATSIGSELGLLATAPPAPDEAATLYVQRIFRELEKRGDYALLKRAGEASRLLMRGNFPHDIYPRYTGLCAYLAAQNQEAAAQWLNAVLSYQRALRDGADFVPAAAIGQRLAEIQRQHPAEYRQGMAAFLGDTSPRIANVYLSIVPDPSATPAPPDPAPGVKPTPTPQN